MNHTRRRVFTKQDLQPPPPREVHAKLLKYYLALAAVASGEASERQVTSLIKAAYLAYFIMDTSVNRHDIAQFRQAEDALARCRECVTHNRPAILDDDDFQVILPILRLHDMQLEATAQYRYTDAWNRLQRHFKTHPLVSPIPSDDVNKPARMARVN